MSKTKVLLSITENENGSIDCITGDSKEISAALAGGLSTRVNFSSWLNRHWLCSSELAMSTLSRS